MDKEIKGYKDDSNEEKNTETNEKNDLIDKDTKINPQSLYLGICINQKLY